MEGFQRMLDTIINFTQKKFNVKNCDHLCFFQRYRLTPDDTGERISLNVLIIQASPAVP